MTDILKIYIFPISGGEFPNQLALLSQVYYAILKSNGNSFQGAKSYSPNICLGASGGNIASYIGLAADWNPEQIISICKEIDPQIFIRNWWPGPLSVLPSAILGIFNKSLYRPGYGVTDLFNSLFPNSESITRTEILTLTFNETKKLPQIFTNRGEEDSYFKENMFTSQNDFFFQVSDITYNDGDINKIAESTVASYSIPLITQLQTIDGHKYADGGISYASPFSPIYTIIKDNYPPIPSRKIQLTYFCSYDMNDLTLDRASFYGNSSFAISLQQMLHTSILQDREKVKVIMELFNLNLTLEQGFKINTDELALIIGRISQKNYALILYPSGAPHIDILNFKTQDILDTMEKASKDYNYYLFYEA